ncbi:MAG: acyl-CoA thioesterase [Gammaproteobacteria bacterium]|nr:acyl-CoA thioesterase [Gammaproteobacteria bacterium]
MTKKGILTIQTIAMPADTNANGDIFGGWLVSQMDLGASILAKSIAKSRVVTVAINSTQFLRPVAIGDVVCCHTELVKKGRTSMTIDIEIWTKNFVHQIEEKVAIGQFVFVAIDEKGRPRAVDYTVTA